LPFTSYLDFIFILELIWTLILSFESYRIANFGF
jgi:hypothetical protein